MRFWNPFRRPVIQRFVIPGNNAEIDAKQRSMILLGLSREPGWPVLKDTFMRMLTRNTMRLPAGQQKPGDAQYELGFVRGVSWCLHVMTTAETPQKTDAQKEQEERDAEV